MRGVNQGHPNLLLFSARRGHGLARGLFARQPFSGPTCDVKLEKLKVAIVERGSLESAKNGDIICTVRSGTKGSTNATTIKWILDAGVEVKKPASYVGHGEAAGR